MILLLNHQHPSISIPCLRTIGNIVTGDDDQTELAVEAGLIEALNVIIKHDKKTIRKESCWVLSNITAGSHEQIQHCLDSGIIDTLIQILQHDSQEVKSEAVWALSNCTACANPDQFGVLVEKGIIKALGGVLKLVDVKMLAVSLEGLDNIFQCGQKQYLNEQGENKFTIIFEQEGYLDDLENLQTHPNHTIYNQALTIIDKFMQAEDEDPLVRKIQEVQQNAGQNPMQTPGGTGLFSL